MQLELAQALVNIVKSTLHDDVAVYPNYSGRGMFGETTAGIVGVTIEQLLECVIIAIINEHDNELQKLRNMNATISLEKFKTDSLGYDNIIY